MTLVPAYAEAAITSQLDVGDSGEDVTELQTFLAADASLYPEGFVTGYFGPLTEVAVKRLQARYGIEQVGRVGPITMAKLNELMGAGGGTGGSDDVWAPVISNATVSVSGTSATVNWTTNETASSRVMYGASWPFLYASAASVSSAVVYGTNHSVVLSGLLPNTTYHYVIESIDVAGNLQWMVHQTFTTGQ